MTPSLPGAGKASAGTPGKFSLRKLSQIPWVLSDINEFVESMHGAHITKPSTMSLPWHNAPTQYSKSTNSLFDEPHKPHPDKPIPGFIFVE